MHNCDRPNCYLNRIAVLLSTHAKASTKADVHIAFHPVGGVIATLLGGATPTPPLPSALGDPEMRFPLPLPNGN